MGTDKASHFQQLQTLHSHDEINICVGCVGGIDGPGNLQLCAPLTLRLTLRPGRPRTYLLQALGLGWLGRTSLLELWRRRIWRWLSWWLLRWWWKILGLTPNDPDHILTSNIRT